MTEAPSLWHLSHTDTNDFISKHLRPSQDLAKQLDSELDTVVNTLRTRVTYNISRVRRGGSLATCIHLQEDEYDFELYIFIADLRGIDEYRKGIGSILTETRDVLDTEDLLHLLMIRGDKEKILEDGFIPMRVLVNGDEWFEGKVIPMIDLLGVSPSKATIDTMYRQFADDKEKACFFPALSILYINLIQSLPENVRDLMLLMQYWERTRFQLRGRKPPPRFWEVLVIRRWEMAGSPRTFNCTRGLYDVIETLADWRSIFITWETSADKIRCYSKKIAEEKRRECDSRHDDQSPVIYDPVDPRLDHTQGIRALVWNEMARTALETCNDRLFEGVKRLKTWVE